MKILLITAFSLISLGATYTKDVKVLIPFVKSTPYGVYSDTLTFSKIEFELKSDAELEVLKNARVNSWIASLEAAKTAPKYVPTTEDIDREIAELEARIVVLKVLKESKK